MHVVLIQILGNKLQIETTERDKREKKAQSTDFARIIKSRVTNNSDETVVDSTR